MMLEGVDYSYARPGGVALAAAGKHFACRYLPYSFKDSAGNPVTDGGKGLTQSEVSDLHAHGIDIVLVFEWYAGRAKAGQAAGVFDAKLAQAALAALGVPADRPVYFAVDWDMAPTDEAAVAAYFAGVASVLGLARTGVYGGLSAVQHAQAGKWATWFWQTYAWSAGITASGIHLYQYSNSQYINGAVDYDRSLVADFGQWTGDTMGIAVKLNATTDTNPFDALGTAHNGSTPTTFWNVADASTLVMPAGSNLGVVQLGTAVDALSGSYPAGTAIIATNINGKLYVTPLSAVTFTLLPAPAPTDCSSQVAAAVAPLNSQVSALQSQVAAAQAQVTTLQGQLTAAQKKISDYIAADTALRS